jgi:hypothetical protein
MHNKYLRINSLMEKDNEYKKPKALTRLKLEAVRYIHMYTQSHITASWGFVAGSRIFELSFLSPAHKWGKRTYTRMHAQKQ